jgi:hypothetical protein
MEANKYKIYLSMVGIYNNRDNIKIVSNRGNV